MKRLKLFFTACLSLVAATGFSAALMLGPVTVTLQNKCPRAVKYEIKGSKPSNGTIEANGKVKLSIEPGHQVFADGELCVQVTANDNGATYIVCR